MCKEHNSAYDIKKPLKGSVAHVDLADGIMSVWFGKSDVTGPEVLLWAS